MTLHNILRSKEGAGRGFVKLEGVRGMTTQGKRGAEKKGDCEMPGRSKLPP